MGTPGLVEDGVLTLAVLGDSTAAGIGDPLGAGRFRGFGPLLAGALGTPDRVRLLNTGRSGARVGCVRREQLPAPSPPGRTWPYCWSGSTTRCGPTSTHEPSTTTSPRSSAS